MRDVHDATRTAAGEILRPLVRSQDLTEACSLLVERVAEASGVAHALLVLCGENQLHGAARHLSYRRMAALLHEADRAEYGLRYMIGQLHQLELLPSGSLPPFDRTLRVAAPVRGADGSTIGMLLLEGDGLDMRHAEAAALVEELGPALELRRDLEEARSRLTSIGSQRQLLSRVLDTLSDPILVTDERNDVVLANPSAERLFVPSSEDSEGRRRAIEINNLLFSSFLTQAAIGAARENRELTLVDTVEGSDLHFEVISVQLRDGASERVLSVLRDITDLKRAVTELEIEFNRSRAAEHAARQERDRLNVILENVSDPILVTDEHSNIILMNPEADRLFVPPDDAPEGPLRQLIRANDTRFSTLVSNFLLRNEPRALERITIVDPDDHREFPVEVVSSRITNTRGDPVAIVSILHDLTQAEENERLARELRRLNDELEARIQRATMELEERNRRLEYTGRELEKASQLKSEFLASMSHELRTPLNVVLGYTSLMREGIYGELNTPQEEALERIYSTSQHLLDLISHILDLSKIEAGMMPVHIEQVSIPLITKELSAHIAPIVDRKGLVFDRRVPEQLPEITTDRTKVKQILLNLLSNAIKFTSEGTIRLEATMLPDRGGIRLEVRDTGIGIRPEHLDQIFEAFRQIDQSHTREYAGTGLGLSITKKLLDLLHGRISVESEFGKGTCFSVELPDLALEATTLARTRRAAAS